MDISTDFLNWFLPDLQNLKSKKADRQGKQEDVCVWKHQTCKAHLALSAGEQAFEMLSRSPEAAVVG